MMSVATHPSDQRLAVADRSLQHVAVARLTTLCERIAASGILPFDQEFQLRTLTNLTCTAFDMATVSERPSKELVEHQGER